MNDSILVSVIIPVYNVEKYLSMCLDSVCSQTYKNLEIILVDDGSTDSSSTICDEYARKDSRIKVFHTVNFGVSHARNVGLDNVNGKYVMFIDSDDTVDLEYVQKMIAPCMSEDYDLIVCNIKDEFLNKGYIRHIRKLHGKITGSFEKDYSSLRELMRIPVIKIYNRNIINEIDLRFDENMKNSEDQLFNAKYFLEVKKYKYIDEALYTYYHRKNNSLSQTHTVKCYNDNLRTLETMLLFCKKRNIKKYKVPFSEAAVMCAVQLLWGVDRKVTYKNFRIEIGKLYDVIGDNFVINNIDSVRKIRGYIVSLLMKYKMTKVLWLCVRVQRFLSGK